MAGFDFTPHVNRNWKSIRVEWLPLLPPIQAWLHVQRRNMFYESYCTAHQRQQRERHNDGTTSIQMLIQMQFHMWKYTHIHIQHLRIDTETLLGNCKLCHRPFFRSDRQGHPDATDVDTNVFRLCLNNLFLLHSPIFFLVFVAEQNRHKYFCCIGMRVSEAHLSNTFIMCIQNG